MNTIPPWILTNSKLLKDQDLDEEFICQNLSEYKITVNSKILTEFPSTENINSYEEFKIVLAIIKYFDIPYPITVFSFLLNLDKEDSISLLNELKQDLPPFEHIFYDSLINFLNAEDKYEYALEEKNIDNLGLFILLHKKGRQWNKWVCADAAKHGRLDCLKYAKENGCPWDKWTCAFASLNGHLDCLKYARDNGCDWDEATCASAAENGHLHCLKYAREKGCQCPLASSRREE
jgi:hypothetical protein